METKNLKQIQKAEQLFYLICCYGLKDINLKDLKIIEKILLKRR